MIIAGYILLICLVLIAISKMLETWELANELSGKRTHVIVRSFFGFFDLISNIVSLKIFK